MPAPPSSLIDPAIGHLVQLTGDVAGEQSGLLGVLAGMADPRHRRGVRHWLAGILGLALWVVMAGARSFTATAEWGADADRETLRMLGATGAAPLESTFRRTLQRLDAVAFDGLAGSWAQRRALPAAGGSSRSTARLYAARPAAANPVSTCWRPSIMPIAPSWARWKWGRRTERNPDVHCAV